jgi:hypothetical protein
MRGVTDDQQPSTLPTDPCCQLTVDMLCVFLVHLECMFTVFSSLVFIFGAVLLEVEWFDSLTVLYYNKYRVSTG